MTAYSIFAAYTMKDIVFNLHGLLVDGNDEVM